jgi:hypothetical protein
MVEDEGVNPSRLANLAIPNFIRVRCTSVLSSMVAGEAIEAYLPSLYEGEVYPVVPAMAGELGTAPRSSVLETDSFLVSLFP